MAANKAVFLDRDGVINELVYHLEQEVIDSPFTPNQFKLMPGVVDSIRLLKDKGFVIVVVSNQPGIAKGTIQPDMFEKIKQKMGRELREAGAELDGEYYCFHHPEGKLVEYRVKCECRKPKPGMLLKAAQEMDIDLRRSWLVGDNLSDIQAGQSAGCKTVLLGNMKCVICHAMDERGVRPDNVSLNLLEAAKYILSVAP